MSNSEVFDTALGLGIIKKAGAWYKFGEINLGQGKEARVLDPALKTMINDEIKSLSNK